MHTRRKFLRDCSLAVTAAGFAPAALAHQPMPTRMPVERLGLAHFYGQLNTDFTVRSGGQTTALLLVQANGLPGADASEGERSFSLLFHGPAESPLPQDTYVLDHPVFGGLPIFIVPVGPAVATHSSYEAIFNRLAS